MKDFKGKVAVVTGAGSGIGLGMAHTFAQQGMAIVLCDNRPETLEPAADQVRKLGGRALTVSVDVSDRATLERAADEAEKAFGQIDIVCNNAGVLIGGKPIEATTPPEWDWLIGINLYGVINGVQTFVPRIRKHGHGGHVVNTSSIGGFQVRGEMLTGAYSVTKYGVLALTEALAHDLDGTGIGVSVLAPGAVNTNIFRSAMHRPARYGGPELEDRTPDELKHGMSPDLVGRRVLAAIRDGDFYVFTHLETKPWLEARHARIIAAYDATERWAKAEGLLSGAR